MSIPHRRKPTTINQFFNPRQRTYEPPVSGLARLRQQEAQKERERLKRQQTQVRAQSGK